MANAIESGQYFGRFPQNWPTGANPAGFSNGNAAVKLVDIANQDSTAVVAADLLCSIRTPIGTVYSKNLAQVVDAPGNDGQPTFQFLQNGVHIFRLWGGFKPSAGAPGFTQNDLAFPGIYSIDFEDTSAVPTARKVSGWYEVFLGRDIRANLAWNPGSQGNGILTGAVEVWTFGPSNAHRLDPLGVNEEWDDDLSQIDLSLVDANGTFWLGTKNLLTDPAVKNQAGTFFFEFPISGLPATQAVRATVATTYRNAPFDRTFIVPIRYGS